MEPGLSPHTLLVEGDLIWLTVRGEFTLAHLGLLDTLIEEQARARGYVLTMINATEARLLSKEVRKRAAEHTRDVMRQGVLAASAVYGANSLLIGLSSLLFSALRILTGDAHKNRIVRTEAEARAFLSEQRQQFRRKLGLAPHSYVAQGCQSHGPAARSALHSQ